ncbi:MAG TPA: CHAT domain-containing protein [Thermoanaerobaculia bacterium]|nr:CHAT domain-containing protein [Thermoanaerobaculia bacterium]
MPEPTNPFDRERELIRRLNSASSEMLADLLRRPSPEDERTLRSYLGGERYERMHALALRKTITRAGAKRGNVVVIHGIMGGELTSRRADDLKTLKVWLNYFQLALSRFLWFKLQPDGIHETDPRQSLHATGIIQKYYGELTLRLSLNWNAIPFWYDWRKDIYRSAVELQERAAEAFGRDAPFHIVAHSMGGLVARTFIKRNADVWKRMQANGAKKGGRLIMLGTPTYGSFVVPQIITGLEGILRKLAFIDTRNDLRQYINVANTFHGSYQMMPSLTAMPDMGRLYEAQTWSPIEVQQSLLDAGRAFHDDVDPVKDEWMTYIAGYGQQTLNGIRDWSRIADQRGYTATGWNGDGRVPHTLGLIKDVPTFFVREAHAGLPTNDAVQLAAERLLDLASGESLDIQGISKTLPAERAADPDPDPDAAAAERERRLQEEMDELGRRANHARGTRAIPEETNEDIATEESHRVEEILLEGWLGNGPEITEPVVAAATIEADAAIGPPRIRISVYRGNIDAVHKLKHGPDAVAVGLYVGVRPDGAARALDYVVSAKMQGGNGRFITQMLERGVIQAGLGQPFLLPDPRIDEGQPQRVIALAGMGIPGRFGAPEATVTVRELCWTLGRIGKRHLASVLIGSGAGNLTKSVAVEAWLRGIARAQIGMPDEARLQRVTFAERDHDNAQALDDALCDLIPRFASVIAVQYDGIIKSSDPATPSSAEKKRVNEVPSRVTFTHDKGAGKYRFGSITRTAALPEREIPLDHLLVDEANSLLASKESPHEQMTWGRFLERLLIPAEFRSELQTSDPLVMMLDNTTASIHWEMMAQPGFDDIGAEFNPNAFLGTARGLTRQLRTTFAPPPEPPPPVRRRVRILIVADPAPHAPLTGAQVEAARLAELFADCNRKSMNEPIEVVTLIGPYQARRCQVMKHLMTEQYDVLHFAGHCFFDSEHPERAGWIFDKDEVLTANELNRIDRVPPFVFSNACESGITPNRASKQLPQSFAEAFFGRGVTNFICTAWPISDTAATEFALTVYGKLLGMTRIVNPSARDEDPYEYKLDVATLPLWMAMQEGRIALGRNPNAGRLTWGAYQHYGNPYYRLITRDARSPSATTRTTAEPGRAAAGTKTRTRRRHG